MKTIGVILAGCGVYDGSEIQEAVLTLNAFARRGAKTVCFAPNRAQADVVDHLTGKPVAESRNVLAEAARIARGAVEPLERADAASLDGLVIPGGFGAAKNLCDFAQKGAQCAVLPELEKLILDFYAAKKPMGFVCIAPVIAARVLGKYNVALTVGADTGDTADAMRAWGAAVKPCLATRAWADMAHRVVSTPAYMEAKSIGEVYLGIETLAHEVLALA